MNIKQINAELISARDQISQAQSYFELSIPPIPDGPEVVLSCVTFRKMIEKLKIAQQNIKHVINENVVDGLQKQAECDIIPSSSFTTSEGTNMKPTTMGYLASRLSSIVAEADAEIMKSIDFAIEGGEKDIDFVKTYNEMLEMVAKRILAGKL